MKKKVKHKHTVDIALWQAISLGILAGMRTSSAPLITNLILKDHPAKKLEHSMLAFMQSGKATIPFSAFAAFELIGDKLPATPNRTSAGGLIGRCLSGALAGATIYKANGKNALIGSLLGSSAACVSTFGCYFLRKNIVKQAGIADPIIGAIEDALVISAGIGLVKNV